MADDVLANMADDRAVWPAPQEAQKPLAALHLAAHESVAGHTAPWTLDVRQRHVHKQSVLNRHDDVPPIGNLD